MRHDRVSRVTANVVTRMPPAVEVLPPPMNMTMDRNTSVASLTPGIHDRSNPELRGMTAATMACQRRGSMPFPANSSLLFHSISRNHVNEATTMQNVVVSVSLVCSSNASEDDAYARNASGSAIPGSQGFRRKRWLGSAGRPPSC